MELNYAIEKVSVCFKSQHANKLLMKIKKASDIWIRDIESHESLEYYNLFRRVQKLLDQRRIK